MFATVLAIIVIYLSITFIAVAWTAILTLFLGALMRDIHFEFVFSPSFKILRRHGVWRGAWPYIRDLKRRSLKGWDEAREILWLHSLIFVILGMNYIVSIFTFGGVALLMHPLWNYMHIHIDPSVPTWRHIALLGTFWATWLFLRGFSYIARPWVKHRGRYEQIKLPKNLSAASQNRVAIDAFWLSHIRTASLFVPTSVFLAWMPLLATDKPIMGFDPLSLGPLLLVLFLASIVISGSIASWVIRRISPRWSGMDALVRITRIIDPIDPPSGALIAGQANSIPEPNADLRKSIIEVIELLYSAANRLDAQQERGFTPHPLATALRGCSAQLTTFLLAPNFRRSLPSDIAKILRVIQVVLSGPKNAAPYEELASIASAFEADGSPGSRAEPPVKPPSKVARLFAKATLNLTNSLVAISTLAALAVPIAAIIFALLGQLQIDKVLELLKK